LWHKLAEELPRVSEKPLARCSLSGSSSAGRRTESNRNQLTQDADVETLHSVVSFYLQPFYVNALFNARNILSHNAPEAQALGSTARGSGEA